MNEFEENNMEQPSVDALALAAMLRRISPVARDIRQQIAQVRRLLDSADEAGLISLSEWRILTERAAAILSAHIASPDLSREHGLMT